MRNTVHNVGRAGIVRDTKPHLLDSSVWTDGRNVRFSRNKAFAMGGVLEARSKTGLLNGGLLASPTSNYFIYTTGGKVYSFDGTSEADITRTTGGDYLEDADDLFRIQLFNGFGLLSNEQDTPQEWDPTVGTNKLVPLSNWGSGHLCKSLRPFKSFLIAIGMTESATIYPHKIRWSHPAGPGEVPTSWDDTDPTKEAGSYSFPDTDKGILVDGLELGNRFYIYKQGSIWVLNYVGGDQILSRDNIVNNIGLKVKRSLVNLPFYAGQRVQFFVGDNNFYIMDGLRVIPVWENVFRDEILALVDPDNWVTRSFSVINPRHHEVWFCIPEMGVSYPNLAFCFNFENNTYSIRDLKGSSNIVSGFGFDQTNLTQQNDLSFSDGTFFSDSTGFANSESQANLSVMLETVPGDEKLYYADTGRLDYDGVTPYSSYLLREALATVKNDRRNEQADIVDYNRRKLLTSIVPKIYSGSVALTIGTQELENQVISYGSEVIIPNNNFRYNLPMPVSARFLTFKYSSVPNQDFEFGGFDYEVDMLGEY